MNDLREGIAKRAAARARCRGDAEKMASLPERVRLLTAEEFCSTLICAPSMDAPAADR